MGIAAVAMATAMFAAEPTFNESVAEYKGEASVTWGVDIDNKATGFKNAESASMKVNLFTAGDKTTEGDGIWAELKIKNDAKDTDGSWGLPAVSVDVAKFHIYDVYIGIRSGDVEVGGCKPQTAIKSSNVGIDGVASNKNATQGIVVGYANDYFGIDVDFRSDNEKQYTNKYAVAAEASLKAVENLELKAGGSYAFDSKAYAYAASSSYKIAIGDNYLKPAVGYNSNNAIVGAVIYAWGDEADANAGVYFLDDDAAKKVTPGVSVIYVKDFDAADDVNDLKVAFNLGSVVDNLKVAALYETSLDDFAKMTLAAGASYAIKADDVTITLNAGAKYVAAGVGEKVVTDGTPASGYAVDPATGAIKPSTPAVDPVMGPSDAELKVKVGADFAGLINNTTFSVVWTSGNLLDSTIGTIDLSAKISL